MDMAICNCHGYDTSISGRRGTKGTHGCQWIGQARAIGRDASMLQCRLTCKSYEWYSGTEQDGGASV